MPDEHRRTFLRIALAGAGLTTATAAAGSQTSTETGTQTEVRCGDAETGTDEEATPAENDDGLVTVESDQGFDATVDRIRAAIEGNENLTLVTSVDHASNAESAGLDLRPTTLLVFGNPQLGTQLMQASRTAGTDLPQKLLVWEADDGTVSVTYNDPTWLAERHGIEGADEVLDRIAGALETLATGQ